MAYKKESSSGDITIDVCQGSFCQYAKMQRVELKYLTDLEGSQVSLSLILFMYFDLFSKFNVLQFDFLNVFVKYVGLDLIYLINNLKLSETVSCTRET